MNHAFLPPQARRVCGIFGAHCFFKTGTGGLLAGVLLAGPVAFATSPLLFEDFNYTNGLISNEYAYWNPGDPTAHNSSIWELTSGSLFCTNQAGYTGQPDDLNPNANSSAGNNSAVFRLTTKRADFGDVAVSFALLNQGLTSTPTTPSVDWDGVHIFLHYLSESNLYYASVNRRDNKSIIKKKVPGGPNPSNGGTYYDLTSEIPHTVPYNVWQMITATIQSNQNGSVTIKLYVGNDLVVSAIDNGTIGGPPIRAAGKTGIRGDNAKLKFENFMVTALSSPAEVGITGAITNLIATATGRTSLRLEWPILKDVAGHFFSAVAFSDSASLVALKTPRSVPRETMQADIFGLQPNTVYNVFIHHSKDLRIWSLPSNVAIVQTAP